MKKLLFSLCLLCCLLPALAMPSYAAYADVPDNHWASQVIADADAYGIFHGVGDGRFGLGQQITRAQFVTALVRLFQWDEVNPATPSFTDVSDDSWYYTAVETAWASGAFLATGNSFRPNAPLTREDMASMLLRSLGYAALSGVAAEYSCPFTDVTTNRGYIVLAYDMGLMNGVSATAFQPQGTATREQAAAVLVRLYQRLQQSVSTTATQRLEIPTPAPVEGAVLPTTPLEPIEALYAALRQLDSPQHTLLVLHSGGILTYVQKNTGAILSTQAYTDQQVSTFLSGNGVSRHYSQRYESAYAIDTPNYYQSAVLWYQSEDSIAAKLQLARLFGVTAYIVE